MSREHTISPIAYIRSDFPDKFGIPRQSGLVKELNARIVFEPQYRDINALRGIEDYSHLWLIWEFSQTKNGEWSPTVRPPRLGGNTRVGVFATRSPNRPNNLGLSLVELVAVEGCELIVTGADIMDMTPIYDIKPYLACYESIPDARSGFASHYADYRLDVVLPPNLAEKFPGDKRGALLGVLAGDPRPSYQEDKSRIYGFVFAGYEIKFRVNGKKLTVCAIEKL